MSEVLEKIPTAVDAVVIASILTEIREGRDPVVTPDVMPQVLKALGRGEWSPAQVRDSWW
jgi:hypothetical protein